MLGVDDKDGVASCVSVTLVDCEAEPEAVVVSAWLRVDAALGELLWLPLSDTLCELDMLCERETVCDGVPEADALPVGLEEPDAEIDGVNELEGV